EYVGILEQAIEFRAILFGVVQDGLTHPDLDIPDKRLDLGIVGPPDVENIGPVAGEISADAGPGNHMPHADCANAVERTLCVLLEGDRLAFADFLPRDQRQPRQPLGILTLLLELLEGAHLDYGKPGFDRRVLQIIRTPLQNGVSYGIRAGAALEEAERARGQFGVDIYRHDVPPVARLVK